MSVFATSPRGPYRLIVRRPLLSKSLPPNSPAFVLSLLFCLVFLLPSHVFLNPSLSSSSDEFCSRPIVMQIISRAQLRPIAHAATISRPHVIGLRRQGCESAQPQHFGSDDRRQRRLLTSLASHRIASHRIALHRSASGPAFNTTRHSPPWPAQIVSASHSRRFIADPHSRGVQVRRVHVLPRVDHVQVRRSAMVRAHACVIW